MATLLYEPKGEILYITLNRPEVHNAWDPETLVRLADAWQDFAGVVDEVRVKLGSQVELDDVIAVICGNHGA